VVDVISLRFRRLTVSAFILAGLFCGTAQNSLADEVTTYPGPGGVAPSNQYTVKVEQSGNEYNSFVYLVNSQQSTNYSDTTSWTTFSFAGPVTVTVTKLQGPPIGTCEILPSSFGITPQVTGNSVTFELDQPRKVSVEFDGDITHPMLVFADALETDVPDPNDPDVMYFGPGLHEIGDTTIGSVKTVYLAGGAYVKGRLKANNVQDFALRGRGVLSGEDFPHGTNYDHNLVGISGTRVLVEGITLVNSSLYQILIYGPHNTVRNVKMIGWWFGTDGPYVEDYGLIEDCFVKVNDDAFKLYESNTTVRDCVIWQLENGAPFQISWNMPTDNSGFHVQNIDIIRMEHRTDQINLAAFDAVHGGSGHMSNYLFEDIRIENANWRLFYLTLEKHEFAPPDGEMGQISDLTFRNITATGNFQRPNVIRGWDADHKVYNVTFENLKINGRYIGNAEEGNFDIDPVTTDNIVFTVDEDLVTETEIIETFDDDSFLEGACATRLSDVWAGADSVEVYDGRMHLINTLPDPEAECFYTSGWQTVNPVTPPFTIEYTVDVTNSDFGYGGYVVARLIWDMASYSNLVTDVRLVKETVAFHGQVPGFEDLVQEDQYLLYILGLGLRLEAVPSEGVETITVRQVVTELNQKTYWGTNGGALKLVHTYENIIATHQEITPILVGSDCNVWNHNYFDLAIDGVSVTSEDLTDGVCSEACGNGFVEQSEECDDGNLQPGDGCDESCVIEAFCAPTPAVGCRQSGARGAQIQIKDKAPEKTKQRQLKIKWSRGGATSFAEFCGLGAGAGNTHVCVYDSSVKPQPLVETVVRPGGTCDKKDCWKFKLDKSCKFKDKKGTIRGVSQLVLRPSEDPGRSRWQFRGKGKDLPELSLSPSGLTLPVTVQLLIDDGNENCWQTTYDTFQKNEASQFKAKTD
jgi:cysteine-rich repeat protein